LAIACGAAARGLLLGCCEEGVAANAQVLLQELSDGIV
jgi:hypothetical protein